MRGNVGDVMVLMTLFFGMVLALIISYPIAKTFLDGLAQVNPNKVNPVIDEFNGAVEIFDKALPLFYIVVLLLSLAAASNIGSNPAFFFFMIFLNMMMILGYYIFNEIFTQALSMDATTEINDMLTWTKLFVQYIPMINIGLMMLIGFVQYSKGSVGT